MAKTLEQSVQLHRDGIKRYVNAAKDWQNKGNPGWELYSLFHAVQKCLCVAVSAFETATEGIAYLNTTFKTSVFERAFQLLRELHVTNRLPLEGTPPAGIASLILCVHAAWLLSLHDDARTIASICDDTERLRYFQVHGLWQEYAKGIAAVVHRTPFIPSAQALKGYDKHWATYLHLMSDICAGNDLHAACTMVDESFSQRNKDKRLIGDGLDGDGTFPVKWDFRKHSLLAAVV